MDAPEYSGERPYRRSRVVIRPAAPAAGSDWSLTVPAGHLYHIVSVYASLVTSIAAATRVPNIVIGDGVGEFLRLPPFTSQLASLTRNYAWFAEAAGDTTGLGIATPIPELTLLPGWTVGVATDAIDVGDAWGNVRVHVVDTMFKGGPIDIDEAPELIVRMV